MQVVHKMQIKIDKKTKKMINFLHSYNKDFDKLPTTKLSIISITNKKLEKLYGIYNRKTKVNFKITNIANN